MTVRKTFKELTIKDNFMFGAIMCKEDNCRRLLELVLEVPIARVEVSKEKSIVYHPEYKGVRLDVYAKDEKNTHFNVEMQTVPKADSESAPDITTARSIWRCWRPERSTRNWPIRM